MRINFADAARVLGITVDGLRHRRLAGKIPQILTAAMLRQWSLDATITQSPAEYAAEQGVPLARVYAGIRSGQIPSRIVAGPSRPFRREIPADCQGRADALVLDARADDSPEGLWERSESLAVGVLGMRGLTRDRWRLENAIAAVIAHEGAKSRGKYRYQHWERSPWGWVFLTGCWMVDPGVLLSPARALESHFRGDLDAVRECIFQLPALAG